MTEEYSTRLNVMDVNSVRSFACISGGFTNNRKDVYFIRCLGYDDSLGEDMAYMDQLMGDRAAKNQAVYWRFDHFPRLGPQTDVALYSSQYDNWKAGGKLELAGFTEAPALAGKAGASLTRILELLEKCQGSISESIKKNFVVKQLFWLDTFFQEKAGKVDLRRPNKVVYSGEVKRQEYLFFYLLALLGIDVLLIHTQGEYDLEQELKELSSQIKLSKQGAYSIPAARSPMEAGMAGFGASESSAFRTAPQTTWTPQTSQTPQTSRTPQVTLPPRTSRTPQTIQTPQVTLPPRTSRTPQTIQTPQMSRTPQTSAPYQGRGGFSAGAALSGRPAVSNGERELDFEELAMLAASVVMITVHDNKGKPISTGSGIMIARDGYILTNNHVARGGAYYSVRMEDEEQVYPTDQVIKYNPLWDLALLRIPRQLKPIPLYNGSRKLARGQKVVAIGSPLGLFNSVSDGIISGFRNIKDVDMIQFTAPISPGSSGGAVLNMQGQLIGISTAGFDDGQNLNLAVGYREILSFAGGFLK